MGSPPQRLHYARSACGIAGIRLTSDRERVLEFLAQRDLPWAVEELVRVASAGGAGHMATVYRFLVRLSARGIVHFVPLWKRRGVLLSCETVDYLLCRGCGAIRQLSPPPELERWRNELAARTGFRLARHWHEVSGICAACQHESPP